MNINIFEAIEAANTKPFGFSSFYHLSHVGGHCIPDLDLFFFTYIDNLELYKIYKISRSNK